MKSARWKQVWFQVFIPITHFYRIIIHRSVSWFQKYDNWIRHALAFLKSFPVMTLKNRIKLISQLRIQFTLLAQSMQLILLQLCQSLLDRYFSYRLLNNGNSMVQITYTLLFIQTFNHSGRSTIRTIHYHLLTWKLSLVPIRSLRSLHSITFLHPILLYRNLFLKIVISFVDVVKILLECHNLLSQ